jgi:hypothetical protein
MVIALTAFFFIRTFSLVSISGTDNIDHVLFIIRMFDILGIFLTLCAAVRLLGAESARGKHFFFVLGGIPFDEYGVCRGVRRL